MWTCWEPVDLDLDDWGSDADEGWGDDHEKKITIITKDCVTEYDFVTFQWWQLNQNLPGHWISLLRSCDTGNLDELLSKGLIEINLAEYPEEASKFFLDMWTDENSNIPSRTIFQQNIPFTMNIMSQWFFRACVYLSHFCGSDV